MECWLKAKMYLLDNGRLISQVESFVHLIRKSRVFAHLGTNNYELQELKNINYKIKQAYRDYNAAVRYLGDEFYFQKTINLAHNVLNVLSMVICEKTPKPVNVISKKEKRQEKARLNRSYRRGKNR